MQIKNLFKTTAIKSVTENNSECNTSNKILSEHKFTNKDKEKSKSFNNLAFLHLIRFILALSIVLWHYPFNIANNYETHPFLFSLRAITIYGGNQAFLLISGMMFYIAYYSKLTTGEIKPADFLKKRAIRIYPIVVASVLISYILSLIIHFNINADENINLIDLVKDLLFFGSRLFGGSYGIYNGPIWFLAPLCVSYLISLFIIVITKKKKSIYWFLIPLFITFFSALNSDFIVPVFNFYDIASECFNFFLGFFFMIFLTKFDKWNNLVKIPLRIIGLTVSILFLFAFYKTKTNSPLGNGEMIGSIFCWIPLITCLYGLKFNIIFDNKVFKTAGNLSFHVFIWHTITYKIWFVYFSLQNKPINESCLMLALFMIFVLTISILSYSVCELMRKYKVLYKLKIKIYKLNNQL